MELLADVVGVIAIVRVELSRCELVVDRVAVTGSVRSVMETEVDAVTVAVSVDGRDRVRVGWTVRLHELIVVVPEGPVDVGVRVRGTSLEIDGVDVQVCE